MLTAGAYAPYGLGIERIELDGETVWEHTGFFGAFLYYWPSRRLAVTGSINQANGSSDALAEDVAKLLRHPYTD